MAAHHATRYLQYSPPPTVWVDSEYELDKLRQNEMGEKRDRVRMFLERRNLDGVWLTQPANVIWYSAWNVTPHLASIVPISLLILRDRSYCIASTREGESLLRVFLASDPDLEIVTYDATEPSTLWKLLEHITSGLQIGCDTVHHPFKTVELEVHSLRTGMTPTEQHRYRMLCQDCTTILVEVARAITPGQTEKDTAAEIASRCYAVGIRPTVLFVSADSGLRRTRHPLPGEQIIQRYAILVLEGTRGGLHAGLTRTVAISHLPPVLEQRYYAAAHLNALSADIVRPGALLGDVLHGGLSLYDSAIHPTKWHVRLQGFIQDYERHTTYEGQPSGRRLHPYQSFTLITGINGIQSQETLLLLPDGNSVLTAHENWPVLEFETVNGITYRPDILRL